MTACGTSPEEETKVNERWTSLLTATCAYGLEPLVTDEFISFGARKISKANGAVIFRGDMESAYRACLWSRFASRVLLHLAEFSAPDTDSLYNRALDVNWEEHLSINDTFAVTCTSSGSSSQHTKYCALRVKDAVADHFRGLFNRRPSVNTNRPSVQIHLFLDGETATLSLDLAGESLHRRGYRIAGVEAPLKESLAAAVLHLAGWPADADPDGIFIDPMCGSGTLLIEAALIYGDIAPGLGRDYFGFLGWREYNKTLWQNLVAEARERRQLGLRRAWPRILGFDASPRAVSAASSNVLKAGLKNIVHVEKKELAHLQNPLKRKKEGKGLGGFIVTNPPYGERLDSLDSVHHLYRYFGKKLKEEFTGWRVGVFASELRIAEAIGLNSLKRYRLFNGQIPCQLSLFDVPTDITDKLPPETALPAPTPLKESSFENRLKKNLKLLRKWAIRESISCYRIYDADIPEYNMAVDLYEKWVHVQEYAPPKTVAPEKAAMRMKEAIDAIKRVLGVRSDQVFVKVRRKQKGKAQYQKKRNTGKLLEVLENNCRFLINLADYVDTGLFLDQRIIRRMIQEKVNGVRFLNLFGYTGSATVYAAVGGATTTTVDLSPVYLKWALSNLAINGFSSENHHMIQDDCLDWLSRTRDRFELIFANPPTFSNSKRTGKVFDIQKDHPRLIRLAMKRLERNGELIFLSNFKQFKMDKKILSDFNVLDISRPTIPRDFQRRQRNHHCWEIRHS